MQIKLLRNAPLPSRAYLGDVGFDLQWWPHSPSETAIIPARGSITLPTGISIAVPRGYSGDIRPRSGLAKNAGIAALYGTVDPCYTGEILVTLVSFSDRQYVVSPGDRIAQLVITRVYDGQLEVVDELSATDRGRRGFGSSGL